MKDHSLKVAPLIAIVGETASGKSALALRLAKEHNGEIICADSRTVYIGMDIGTAKPTQQEQADVPHHLLDIVRPDASFNVGDFKSRALQAIEDIHSKEKLPIMVGGTGLYIDSVLFDYKFADQGAERDEVNPRHLKEDGGARQVQPLRENTLVLGIQTDPKELKAKIEERIYAMIAAGLESEVKELVRQYGWTEALSAVGYREWQSYFAGQQTGQETIERIVIATRQYAKRQRTWFKRNKSIQWVSTPEEAHVLAEQFLNNRAVD